MQAYAWALLREERAAPDACAAPGRGENLADAAICGYGWENGRWQRRKGPHAAPFAMLARLMMLLRDSNPLTHNALFSPDVRATVGTNFELERPVKRFSSPKFPDIKYQEPDAINPKLLKE
jgi:hypothetical protein